MDPTDEQKNIAKTFMNDLDENLPFLKATAKQEDDKVDDKVDDKIDDKVDDKVDDKKEDIVPIFTRPQKGKDKEESIATLRKQRDEDRNKLKVFTETFGEHKPEAIKPLLDFIIEEADGPITPEYVVEKLDSIKKANDEIARLKAELDEKEKVVTELDVRHSKEFKEGFEEPYKAAMNELFLEFATVAPDKTIIAPKATKAFNDFLTTNPEVTAIDVKSELLKFSKAFVAESGEDPVLPSITSIMNALRKFNFKRTELQGAYTNWKETKKAKEQQEAAKNQIQSEAQKRSNKRMRTDLASKAFREFDLDSLPFVTEKEAEELFKEEFIFGEDIIDGKNVPAWDELFQRGVKARLFDKWAPEIIELLKLKEAIEEGERNNIPGRGRRKEGSAKKKVDWLAGVE